MTLTDQRQLRQSTQNHQEILEQMPCRHTVKFQFQNSQMDTWASLIGRQNWGSLSKSFNISKI